MNAPEARPETPLQSWKEIGAYIQRDATTARRWEKEEGLPVHRHSHKSRSSVYAYPSEIDSWRAGRKVVVEPSPARHLWEMPAFAAAMFLCLVMVGNGVRSVAAQSGPTKKLCPHCADLTLITSDGRWVAAPDGKEGNIVVRELINGKETKLTNSTDQSAEWAVLSPDQRQVVYLWDLGPHYQVRTIANKAGSTPRILVDVSEFDYYDAIDWSRDGKSIYLIGQARDRATKIVSVAVSDGSIKTLRSLDWRLFVHRWTGASLSPDGRYIAYGALVVNPKTPAHPTDYADEHIYMLATDGSGESEVIKEAGINSQPTWTPDGLHIIFASNRSGKFDLWSLPVKQGKADGEPTRIVPEIGEHKALGMTRVGSYYYQQPDNVEYVTIMGKGSQVEAHFAGIRPTWSPDAKSVAFKRHHDGTAGAFDLVVRDLESRNEKTYTTRLGFTGNGEAVWLSDTTIGLGISQANGTKPGPYELDLKTGEFRASHRTSYVVRRETQDGKELDRIIAVDSGTREEKTLLTVPSPWTTLISLSPDGRTLGIMRMERPDAPMRTTHFGRLSVDGTGYREIASSREWTDGGEQLAWSPDGKAIVFTQVQKGAAYRLMRIPAEGGTPEYMGIETKARVQNVRLSPDGSRVAYSSIERGPGYWVLDNLLSAIH